MQDPEKAKIIFLSSDANYSQQMSNHLFSKTFLNITKMGLPSGKSITCHHPFILPNYPKEFDKRKDGVPFHRNFSKLGLQSRPHAEHISFLEILDVPTIGNKSENKEMFFDLLCRDHLKYIDKLIQGGGHKLFIVAKGVLDDINAIKNIYINLFGWYIAPPKGERFTRKLMGIK